MIYSLLRILYSGYTWFLTLLVFITHFVIANTVTAFPVKDKETVYYNLAKPIIKLSLFLSGIRVKTHHRHRFPTNYNGVVVTNHQSLFDIFILVAYAPTRLVFFAKKELQRVPILNTDIQKAGHVYVDREHATKALQQLEKMESKLANNLNVIVFAEGTRSADGSLSPFKRGAFHLAAKTNKPIFPCYIHGTHHILPKDSWLFRPGTAHLSFGDPVASNETALKPASVAMQKKAFAAVCSLQDELLSSH